jgi:glucokinase
MTSSDIGVLEIGGTHVTAALVRPGDWSVIRQARTPLDPTADAAQWLKVVIDAANSLDVEPGSDWSVAVPGPFEYATGVARFEGVGKFEDLYGLDVGAALRAGINPKRLSFINDASAFALGEWLVGTAVGYSTFVAITLGTGIGSGFVRAGRVIEHGPDVPPDGEAHFLQRNGVPLEDLVSRRALIARYGDQPGVDVREIAGLARAGDPVAVAAFGDAFTVLGEVLGPWLTRFGAEVLVVGGSISGAWDLIAGPLSAGIRQAVPLLRATELERSALVGAANAATT